MKADRTVYRGWKRVVRRLALVLGVLTIAAGGATAGNRPETQEAEALAGRWVRPDGGYLLEISDIGVGGVLKAAYFNPRPINVARAQWRKSEGGLELFVELRDLNYPGSQYTLLYDPATDRLRGTYYQAVVKEAYDIEFWRVR